MVSGETARPGSCRSIHSARSAEGHHKKRCPALSRTGDVRSSPNLTVNDTSGTTQTLKARFVREADPLSWIVEGDERNRRGSWQRQAAPIQMARPRATAFRFGDGKAGQPAGLHVHGERRRGGTHAGVTNLIKTRLRTKVLHQNGGFRHVGRDDVR